jgi:integrase/recombinase XerD
LKEIRDVNITQRTTLPFLAQEDYLELLIETFLETKKAENVSAGTSQFYKQKLTSFNKYCLTQEIKTVSQISPSTIREYLLFLRGRGNNDGGVHAHFRSVRTFFKWYEREFEPEGWKNPVSKVKAPKVAVEPLEPASFEDVDRMMKACGNSLIGKRDRAILYVLLDSGVRASELLAIQLNEIDILGGQVFIRKGKGRKPRVIYLGEKSRRAVRQYLKLRKDHCPALWVTANTANGGEPLSYWGLVSEIKRLAAKAKVPKPSIHSFRYFFALTSLRNGMDVFSLQKAGGWASLTVMRRYLKQVDSDVETAMKRYSPVDNLT